VTSRVRRRILSSAAAIAAALVVAAAVHAHGGETFMSAEPARVELGGAVGITADLLTSGPLTLRLAGTDGSRREVGVVEETAEGHFQVVVEVPTDLPVGVWTLLAEADGTVYGSTVIEVSGTPIEGEGGGQGPRDDDDALLQPLPSGWQASRSMAPVAVPTNTGIASDTMDPVPFIAGGLAVLALIVLARATRRQDPSR
jgi:methionine-rich copper-binding protein CopC